MGNKKSLLNDSSLDKVLSKDFLVAKKIIELYTEMKTPKEVGTIVGIGGDTVRKVLKENGIYIRKSWEYPRKAPSAKTSKNI